MLYNLFMNKIKLIEWFGTVTSVVGSFLVAFGILFPGFIFFTLGAVSWIIASKAQKNWALLTLNSVFLVANIIGLVRAF